MNENEKSLLTDVKNHLVTSSLNFDLALSKISRLLGEKSLKVESWKESAKKEKKTPAPPPKTAGKKPLLGKPSAAPKPRKRAQRPKLSSH
jgi:hypothetical protein